MNCFGLQAGPDPPGPVRYGPKGPKGLRGDPGNQGDHSISNQCFRSVLTDSVLFILYFIYFLFIFILFLFCILPVRVSASKIMSKLLN